jgi:NAD-dependent DNA ligase
MCRVILADGVISIDEARSLAGWLESNRDQNLQWPADALDERLSRALDDDVLDTEEETELLEILTRITGDPTTIDHGHSRTALLSFDQPEPIVLMEGRTFCFIGRYLTGTLGTVERMTMKGGGETVSKVTSDLDYLVIGSIGSGDSIRSMHGIKIDKATRQRERDGATAIITEEAWHAALDSVLAIKAGSAR